MRARRQMPPRGHWPGARVRGVHCKGIMGRQRKGSPSSHRSRSPQRSSSSEPRRSQRSLSAERRRVDDQMRTRRRSPFRSPASKRHKGRAGIDNFFLGIQRRHPDDSVTYTDFAGPAYHEYGSMRKLVQRDVVAPHLLHRKAVTEGMLNTISPDFWSLLERVAHQNGSYLKVGHKMLIARALQQWILHNIPQE